MRPKAWWYIGAILFALIINDEVVSHIILTALVLPPALKFAGTILDGHAHPGKYSEYSDK